MKKIKFEMVCLCIVGTLLTSCSGQHPIEPDAPVLTPVITPSSAPVPTQYPTDAPEPSNAEVMDETPTSEPTPSPTPIPEPNLSCMYLNYANSFPVVVTNDYIVEFHYDDTVTVTNSEGQSYKFSLSQSVASVEIDLSDPDLWYFCGAFQLENIIYAHYDYLNGMSMTPSMLIKIELHDTDADVDCCILSSNPKKHFQDNFTAAKNQIYYTNTYYTDNGKATTDIMRTDMDGGSITAFYEGIPGETIHCMTCDGNYLSYVITGLDGKHRFISINLITGEENLLTTRLSQPDFLIGWNGYVLTSVQSGRLAYIDCETAAEKSIAYTNDDSVSAGYPLTDGSTLYLPLIRYSGNIATILVPLDLRVEESLPEIRLDDSYYHSVGMIDEFLYAENVDSFKVFDLTKRDAE